MRVPTPFPVPGPWTQAVRPVPRPAYLPTRIGAVPPVATGDAVEVENAGFFSSVPNLLLFGVISGAAFALGSGLVSKYVLKR